MKLAILLFVSTWAMVVQAQPKTSGMTALSSSTIDFTSAVRTAPCQAGSGAPTSINGTVGDCYIRTSGVTAGQNLYLCTTTGTPCTWTQITGTGTTYSAGTCLTLVSTTFSLDTACAPTLLGSNTFAGSTNDFSGTTGTFKIKVAPLPTPTADGEIVSDSATHRYKVGVNGATYTLALSEDRTNLGTGTSVTLASPRQYYVCTSTCTITVPVPAAGMEFCVMNGNNVSTVITLSAIGSSARYENTARTAYGTAGTGTLVSGGAVGDKVCIVGLDTTHYLTASYQGTWTAN